MPILVDRRTHHALGRLSWPECEQLLKLFDEPSFDEDGAPLPVDPRLVEEMMEEGASREFFCVLEQVLQGREVFDLDIESDPR